MNNVQLHLGDCLSIMKTMPENSVDSIVCDPPYMLNFMGKAFDKAKDNPAASVDVWAQALRVAKPGAHLLAFGGDRTHHRMMVAIEDAGWEIRTCLYWCFGSGFPKSLDVGKQIDKANGRMFEDRYALGRHIRECREAKGISRAEVNAHFNAVAVCNHWEAQDANNAIAPTPEHWEIIKKWFGCDSRFDYLVDRIGAEREVVGQDTKARSTNGKSALPTMGAPVEYQTWDITAPATDAAKQWQGWGTSLKPAVEIIVMARKPLIGTVAANVQAWGTGGINVDACRISHNEPEKRTDRTSDKFSGRYNGGENGHYRNGDSLASAAPQGRWPANLCLDPEAAALLDEMSGVSKSKASFRGLSGRHDAGDQSNQRIKPYTNTVRGHDDSGGASRFFARFAHDEDDAPLRFLYQSKASKRDRDEGLEGMNPTIRNDGRAEHLDSGNVPMNRSNNPKVNHHPTVKPTALCRWLVRLVTPPGGTVLDCFAGSGSTGKAAVLEGFHFIGIELDEEYLAIAEKRIQHAQGQAAQPPAHMPQLPLLEMTGD